MQSTSIIKKSVLLSTIIVLFIFGCGGNFNPLTWKEQIGRFCSPQQLVQPEKTALLYGEMADNVKDDPVQVFSVIEWKIQYRNDLFNHKAFNHLATAEEVLRSGQDDCDGQAVVLCSVLRYAGYNAYAVIGPYHSWVEVKEEETVLINFKEGNWFVKFNESQVEWNYGTLAFMILWEFLLLVGLFSLVIYGYEKDVPSYIGESVGYIKYVLAILLTISLAAVIMSRWWVPGLMTFGIALLIAGEIIARLRRWHINKKRDEKTSAVS